MRLGGACRFLAPSEGGGWLADRELRGRACGRAPVRRLEQRCPPRERLPPDEARLIAHETHQRRRRSDAAYSALNSRAFGLHCPVMERERARKQVGGVQEGEAMVPGADSNYMTK